MSAATKSEPEIYRVRSSEEGWHVERNERRGPAYDTKEAAFQSVFAPASDAVRNGREVMILVPGARADESPDDHEETDDTSWSSLT